LDSELKGLARELKRLLLEMKRFKTGNQEKYYSLLTELGDNLKEKIFLYDMYYYSSNGGGDVDSRKRSESQSFFHKTVMIFNSIFKLIYIYIYIHL
jgi:hypothetical protein